MSSVPSPSAGFSSLAPSPSFASGSVPSDCAANLAASSSEIISVPSGSWSVSPFKNALTSSGTSSSLISPVSLGVDGMFAAALFAITVAVPFVRFAASSN